MSNTSTNNARNRRWWSPGDPFAPGARVEVEIPAHHPWMSWLEQYADESQSNGGLMQHGVLTMKLGDTEQRYDLLEVNMDSRSMTYTAVWRMYGDPTYGSVIGT